jgi:hypothetical protein
MGTQIFQLRQRVKIGKVEVSLIFDGSSSLTVMTKEFTMRGS